MKINDTRAEQTTAKSAFYLSAGLYLGGQGLCVKGAMCGSLVGLSPTWNLSQLQMSCLFAAVLLTVPLADWQNTVVDVPPLELGKGVATRVVSASRVSACKPIQIHDKKNHSIFKDMDDCILNNGIFLRSGPQTCSMFVVCMFWKELWRN